RHFNYQFKEGNQYAITGANGSGKSTLLQIIAGAALHSEGHIRYESSAVTPGSASYEKVNEPYIYISFAAPYLELIEEMTATEFLIFHSKFKKLLLPVAEILSQSGLKNSSSKQIRYFSSGMKQRLKLAQAFFTESPVLLIDEPTTNLDAQGIALYHRLITSYTKNRLLIISSNDEQEYGFCTEVIKMADLK
ncbi:MAG: ATP-binding cassette domain-containing protein, partial [Ferruginibacter sp.]